MTHISIVSPVYKAESIIPELLERTEAALKPITNNYEIIFVEDCSPDDSWEVIEKLSKTNEKLKGLKLSRNFGQHYAITAGLDHVNSEWVVVMDCDLQDRPEEIPKLYSKAQEGYDAVLARRTNRKDNFFKKLSSKIFYRTLGYLTGSMQDETVANFGIYNKKIIDSVKSMRESIRFFPTMVKWVGFEVIKIDVEHLERKNGETSYNYSKQINLALDIVLAYSDKPIRLVIRTGIIISLISVLVAIFYLYKWIVGEVIVLGFASLIISIWLLCGIIIAILGVIGLYIGKTFEGVKRRPIYIISKKV